MTRRHHANTHPQPRLHLQPHGLPAGDSRPIPDPTELTTAALVREIASLKEVIFTRLDGMDRAIVIFNENLTRAPTEVDKQIAHLKELHEEKFTSVQIQFKERDVRVEQTARDTKVAVDAALAAQEKAVGKQTESFQQSIAKSEAATNKQIDQLGQLLGSTNLGTDAKIADIKERLTRLEGENKGERQAVVTQQTSNMNMVSIVGLVIGTLVGVAGIVIGFVVR